MGKFEVTLKNGKTVHVHAPSAEDALAHQKAAANHYLEKIEVGGAAIGQPNQVQRMPNPVRAAEEEPVSAKQVK